MKPILMASNLVGASLILALAGCSMIPDYQRPESPVASGWPRGEAYATSSNEAMVAPPLWQNFFRDPQLRNLIGVALENNRDLRVSALNVEATRALYRIQSADRLPSLSADAAGSRTRTPSDLNGTTQSGITSQYSATLGVAGRSICLAESPACSNRHWKNTWPPRLHSAAFRPA
jgi:multidrug efflux system outer membrane protein